MSGGHFDYKFHAVNDMADELERELQKAGTVTDWGGLHSNYTKSTLNILQECTKMLRITSDIMKEVEWLYSADTGEESFREALDPLLEKMSEITNKAIKIAKNQPITKLDV